MMKRILSIVLSIVMLVGLLPTTALASGDSPEAKWGTSAGNLTNEGTIDEAFEAANADGSTVGYIQLQKNATMITSQNTNNDMTLDLQDYVLSLSNNATITASQGTLNLRNGTIKRAKADSEYMVIAGADSILYIENVTLDGGAVWSGDEDSVLGRRTTNSGITAHNVLLYVRGTATLNEGTVLQNNQVSSAPTNGSGGAVTVFYGGSLTINDGVTIRNNENPVGSGGAIKAYRNSSIVMNGGDIYGNAARDHGGAIQIIGKSADQDLTTFTMNGGTIRNNRAGTGKNTAVGGAIAVSDYSKFVMTGGSITDNTTAGTKGGGVSFSDGNTAMELSNSAVIIRNTANGVANNLYIGDKSNNKVTVGAMVGEDSVGITMANPGTFSDGGASYASCFFSDDSTYTVAADGDDLKLAEPSSAETHSHDMSMACGNDDPMTFNVWNGTTDFPSGNVYLTDNVTLTESLIISSGTVNLCLNGHTITITNSQDAFYVESGATLNICDCSTNQSGKIEKTSASADYPGILNRGGTVNVYSGTVSSSNNSNGIYNYSGTVNVYSGTVSSSQRYGINNKGTVNVYGGTVSGIYSGINNKGTVNVYGGTVSSSYSYGIYNDANLNIYGGTVSGISSGINNGADGEITVSGGTVTSEGDAGTGIYNYGEVTVSGGTVKSTGADGNNYGIYCNTGTLNLSGAPTITGLSVGIYLNNGCTITVGEGGLTNTSDKAISVYMITPGTFTSGWTEKMGENADYDSYFTAWDDGYTVQPDGSGELQLVEKPAHVCQWSYSINADHTDTVVATCIGDGECTSTVNKELTVIAPAHAEVNDSKEAAATLSATSIGGISELPDIVYYKYSQYPNIDESSATTTPFENVGGTYKAQITVGGVTAYTNYTVERLGRASIKQFAVSNVTVNSFVITLDEADRSKTDFVCQFGGETIEFTPDTNGRATITVPDVYAGSNNLWVFVYQKQTDIYKKSNTKDTTVSLKNPEYTVIFNANGGSGTMANQTIEVGTETALSPTSFTRSGYKFSGWATSADGAKVYDDKQSVTDIAAAGESITLFAVWTEKATITISDVQQQYDYTGEPIEFNLNSPLADFTVKYRVKDTTTWSDSIPTEVNIYDVKITRAEDADYKAYEMTFFGKLVINKALQSAPAAPAVVNETIKNKKDGKITGVTSDMEYRKQGDADYTEISGTSLEGLEADTYLVRYKETETHSAGEDKELVIADGKTISAAFDMGGHGTSVDPQSGKAYGDTVTEPAAPADNEWKFIGWYKENTFTDEWDFANDTLSDDTTIYAKWEEKKSVAIDEDAQTYYYDGSEKGFVLSGTDAGLTGFDIQYKIDGTYGSTKPTEFGSYDVKITREYDNEYKAYSKEITRGLVIAQSGTEFTDKQILKDGTPTTTFTYGDTITVKIKPQATGQAAPMMLMSLSAPAKNQMALFYNNGTEDIQISDAAEADSDGYYTMTVNTTENLVMPTNATVSLIAKYVGNNNMADYSETLEITFNKADSSVTAPAPVENLVYNGSEQTLISAATDVVGGTVKYKLEGGEYSTELPQATNAGTYTVYYKVFGDDYHNDTTENSVSVTIAKATPNVSAPTAKTGLVYNGADKELVSAGTTSGGEMQYSLDNSTWTTEIPQGNSAGSYTVYYKVVGDNNYNDVAVQSISVSIAQANMSEAITADGYNGEFDNQAHTISVTIPDGASVKYGTTEGTYELETAPTYTNKGNYKVYYKVEKANHNTITGYADVVITAKDISNAEITLGEALTFNGTAQTQAITSATVDGLTITYDVSGNENTNAGDYTLTITGNGNFTGTTQKTYTIAKGTPSVSAPTAKTGLVYNGADKELVSAGTTSGGEMQYSLDNSTWTTEIPQSNSAGSYTVYYKVVGGTNYNDNAGGTVQVTIAKAQIAKPSADSRTFTYTGNEQTYNVTASDYYTVNGTTRTDAGSQNVTVALKDKNNYEWADGTTDDITFTFNIGKADAEITINGDTSIVKTYGDVWKLPTASSTFGTVRTDKTVENLKNAGTYTVTYYVIETENYNRDTKTVSVTVNPLPVNITWENTESLVYDGNEKTINPVVANKVSGDTFNFAFDGTSTLTATEKGTYTATVTDVGNANYTLTGGINLTKTWAIAEAANGWTTPLSITGWIYGGTANEPTAAAKFGTPVYTYANSVDGAYTSDVPTSAGTWYVKATVAGATSYAEISDTKEFVITEKELNADSITAIGDVTFTGEEIKPAVEVRDGNTILVLGTDYEVAYQDNTNAGTAKVIITFKGNYKGTPEKSFIILPKKINPTITLAAPASNETPVTSIETEEYTATVVWSPTVTDKFAYSTEYTATVTITPKANYTVTGITENEYTIEGATVTNAADSGNITAVFAKTGSRPSSGGVSKYTVKFETNGGTTVANKSVTRNALLAEPTAPTKDGYTFDGWYTDKELATAYDFDTKVTKSFTLYAKWTEIEKEPEDTDVHNCPSKEFTDLDVTAWYHFDTDYVIENGIFKGVTETTFAPDDKLTRAMLVTVLYRVEGEPATNRSIPFADVDMGAYYANAVIWGQQNGIIKGYSETEFGPDDKITREQIAAIMHRYAQYKGIDVSVGESTNILSYDDFDSISEYAIPSMQWAVGSGLIKGKSESTLNPLDNATRAEIAAILHRFIEANK